MFKTIVWATDGSETADRALPYAIELTEENDAKLVVAHCRELLTGRAAALPAQPDEDDRVAKIRDQAAALRSAGLDVETEIVTSSGTKAPRVIADIAAEAGADVIIVGSHGHSSLVGFLGGSVAQRLLHIAPCPVLVAPSCHHVGTDESVLITVSAER